MFLSPMLANAGARPGQATPVDQVKKPGLLVVVIDIAKVARVRAE